MPATARYAGELTDGALALRLQAITRLGVASAPRHLSSIDAAATPQPQTAPPAGEGPAKEGRKLSVVPPVAGATHAVAAPGQPDGARASLKSANTNPTDTTPTTTPTDTLGSTTLAAAPSSSTPADVRSATTPATTTGSTTPGAAPVSSTPATVQSTTTTPATTGGSTTLGAAASGSTPASARSTTTAADGRSRTAPAVASGVAGVGKRGAGRAAGAQDGRGQGGVGGPEGRPGVAPVLPEVRVWGARLAQAVSEVLAGDRPISQLVRFTDDVVFMELNRRVRMLGMNSTAGTRGSKEKSTVRSVRVFMPQPCIAEVAAHVRHGERSRAVAFRLEVRRNRWVCTALELG
ncbi:Rv3235 family protein [Kribbella sp. VKM Ac-2571]|uniref:Rv3235 family protein n=1 Tax=Kribbella sp. VKM Ac-2571 TaxID=2512222 RepID=UPI00141504F8|nr:Rv3235 family protein [Kribbella sp. VKM Ac-2571]